jgi:hypothetical protein
VKKRRLVEVPLWWTESSLLLGLGNEIELWSYMFLENRVEQDDVDAVCMYLGEYEAAAKAICAM